MASNQLYTFMAFGFLTNFFSYIPWTMIFLFTQSFGIHLYNIKKKEECQLIQKNIGRCSHTTDGGKGFGYSIGHWYIASITNTGNDEYPEIYIWMICNTSTYERLTKTKDVSLNFTNKETSEVCVKGCSFNVMERFGTATSSYYRNRKLTISVKPREEQKRIIDDIKASLQRKKTSVVLIHGKPNAGKTMVSLILANELKGVYCSTLAPWEPGDSLASLYSDADPSEEKPLIVAFDEFDGPLQEIHNGITPHKHMRIKVSNKQGWNQLLDEIQMGFYPHLVVILTTNKSPDFFNELDPSYISEHRVDGIYELKSVALNIAG